MSTMDTFKGLRRPVRRADESLIDTTNVNILNEKSEKEDQIGN